MAYGALPCDDNEAGADYDDADDDDVTKQTGNYEIYLGDLGLLSPPPFLGKYHRLQEYPLNALLVVLMRMMKGCQTKMKMARQ